MALFRLYLWTRRLFRKILHPENKIIAFDRDTNAIKLSEKFKKIQNGFQFHHKKFSEIKNIDIKNIKAIIFDLGYSTDQILKKKKFIF